MKVSDLIYFHGRPGHLRDDDVPAFILGFGNQLSSGVSVWDVPAKVHWATACARYADGRRLVVTDSKGREAGTRRWEVTAKFRVAGKSTYVAVTLRPLFEAVHQTEYFFRGSRATVVDISAKKGTIVPADPGTRWRPGDELLPADCASCHSLVLTPPDERCPACAAFSVCAA